MKLLTATREGQGERGGDFCFAVEGELVMLGLVCRADEQNPGSGGCGCGRAFVGLASRRATTTALVRDLELTPDDLYAAVEDHFTATGLGRGVLGVEDLADLVDETVGDMAYLSGRCGSPARSWGGRWTRSTRVPARRPASLVPRETSRSRTTG